MPENNSSRLQRLQQAKSEVEEKLKSQIAEEDEVFHEEKAKQVKIVNEVKRNIEQAVNKKP